VSIFDIKIPHLIITVIIRVGDPGQSAKHWNVEHVECLEC